KLIRNTPVGDRLAIGDGADHAPDAVLEVRTAGMHRQVEFAARAGEVLAQLRERCGEHRCFRTPPGLVAPPPCKGRLGAAPPQLDRQHTVFRRYDLQYTDGTLERPGRDGSRRLLGRHAAPKPYVTGVSKRRGEPSRRPSPKAPQGVIAEPLV